MKKITKDAIIIPATVPSNKEKTYLNNYVQATGESGRLFLFSGDQKIEHLNADFYGPGIAKDDKSPAHLFNIANQARIGAFATQLGLIARFGRQYKNIRYIVKLNAKTNLIAPEQNDPRSLALHTVEDVVTFKEQSGLPIVGIGYTVYLGSTYEAFMLSEAAQAVFTAHHHGLLAILWMYPRGIAVPKEHDAGIIAGAAGVGACLGADFVKVNPPTATSPEESARSLVQATMAAGTTKVICSGGKAKKRKGLSPRTASSNSSWWYIRQCYRTKHPSKITRESRCILQRHCRNCH